VDDDERIARFASSPARRFASKRQLARAAGRPTAARVRRLTWMVRWWTFWSFAWAFAGFFFALAWVAGGRRSAGDISFGVFLLAICSAAAWAAWKLRRVALALRRRVVRRAADL